MLGRIAVVAALLGTALPAAADRLSDLRQVLERFPAKAPFTASATVQVNAGSEQDATRGGSAGLEIESGAAGFTIRVSPNTLEAAEKEAVAKKRDPNVATPTRTAMVALTIFDIIDALDAASMLVDDLSDATLLDEKNVPHNGKPATMVRVKVKPSLATQSRFVAEPRIELKIWIGADGIPVAAERVSNYSAGVLFVKLDNTRTEHWDFAVHGDRLYATSNHEDNEATAVGKHINSSRTVSYTPK